MLITFCPQMYHLLWIKFFLISAHLPTLSKKPITGVGVKSNDRIYFISFFENSTCYFFPKMLSYNTVKELTRISHRGVAQLG